MLTPDSPLETLAYAALWTLAQLAWAGVVLMVGHDWSDGP